MLADGLQALPSATRKILFFTPAQLAFQGAPGSDYAATFASCKQQVAAIAASIPGTLVVDFLIPSPITADVSNYWDPVHYRLPIADRIMADLAAAAAGHATADDLILSPAP
jgi:hypothetical protein